MTEGTDAPARKTLADLETAEAALHERLAELNARKIDNRLAAEAKAAADARLVDTEGQVSTARTAADEAKQAVLGLIDELLARPGEPSLPSDDGTGAAEAPPDGDMRLRSSKLRK